MASIWYSQRCADSRSGHLLDASRRRRSAAAFGGRAGPGSDFLFCTAARLVYQAPEGPSGGLWTTAPGLERWRRTRSRRSRALPRARPGKPRCLLAGRAVVRLRERAGRGQPEVFVRPFPGAGRPVADFQPGEPARSGRLPAGNCSTATSPNFQIMVAGYSVVDDSFSPAKPRVWADTAGGQLRLDARWKARSWWSPPPTRKRRPTRPFCSTSWTICGVACPPPNDLCPHCVTHSTPLCYPLYSTVLPTLLPLCYTCGAVFRLRRASARPAGSTLYPVARPQGTRDSSSPTRPCAAVRP